MLAGELAGEGVEVAHPLDGDEERLVVGEPGGVQVGDLVAEVVLELVDVAAVDAGRVRDVGPPLGDLGLDATAIASRLPGQRSAASRARQTSPSAPRDGRPLPSLVGERGPPVVGDHVVLAAAPFGRRPPLGRHVPEPARGDGAAG